MVTPVRGGDQAYREAGCDRNSRGATAALPGDSLRTIARATQSDRAKYVAAARAAGLAPGEPSPTDAQVAEVRAAVRPASGGRPGDVPERLATHHARIATRLGEGLRLMKIHRRLRAQGVTVPYSSLHRFAQAQLGLETPTMTVRVAEPPPCEGPSLLHS